MRTTLRLLAISLFLVLALPLIAPAGQFGHGSNTCPASGSKAVSASTLYVSEWIVQAPAANTGSVYFGGSTVTTSTGTYIAPGGSIHYSPHGTSDTFNLAQIYFACTVNTDGITYTYVQ